MAKRGRPTKFSKERQRQAFCLAKKGFTDLEIAEVLGIDRTTLFNWRKAYPDFFNTLKITKEEADKRVERSLYERACGYSHPEDKIFNNNGTALIVETVKHYPPDPTSMIFWLKNRQPDKWRENKQPGEGEGEPTPVKVEIVVEDGRVKKDKS